MVRNYKRKTDRGKIPIQTFDKAYDEVKARTMTLREAAIAYEIDKMTLFRYIKKMDESNGQVVTMGYAKSRQIFPENLEQKYIDMEDSREWTNALILEFLSIYEKYPAIWDPKNMDHKDRNHVAEDWKKIKNEFSGDFSIKTLKRKRECLMSTYRTLKRKLTSSLNSGDGKDDVYKPTWFAFATMHNFLEPSANIKRTLNTQAESNYQSPKPACEIKKKRKAPPSPCNIAIKQPMKETSDGLKQIRDHQLQQAARDECSIFGELVAMKLRQLSERPRKTLMNQINNQIFDAEMAQMEQHYYDNPRLMNSFQSTARASSSNMSDSPANLLTVQPSVPIGFVQESSYSSDGSESTNSNECSSNPSLKNSPPYKFDHTSVMIKEETNQSD